MLLPAFSGDSLDNATLASEIIAAAATLWRKTLCSSILMPFYVKNRQTSFTIPESKFSLDSDSDSLTS